MERTGQKRRRRVGKNDLIHYTSYSKNFMRNVETFPSNVSLNFCMWLQKCIFIYQFLKKNFVNEFTKNEEVFVMWPRVGLLILTTWLTVGKKNNNCYMCFFSVSAHRIDKINLE